MIYIAAPLTEVNVANVIASELIRRGFKVVSTWHREVDPRAGDPTSASERRLILDKNREQIRSARAVVAYTATGRPKATYGEIVEASLIGLPVVWIQGSNGEGSSLDDARDRVTIVRCGDKMGHIYDRIVQALPLSVWVR